MARNKRLYGILIGVWDKPEPYFRITLPKFKRYVVGRYKPWRLMPEDKKTPVNQFAGTRESLIAVFPEAISIGSPLGRTKGEAAVMGLIMGLPLVALFLYLGIIFIAGGPAWAGVCMLATALLGCLLESWLVRNWRCVPTDWPIVFNRRDRTVTYSPTAALPFWKFWSTRLEQQFHTLSWDDVRVRSYKYLETNGGISFHDSYTLGLLWGGLGGNPRVLAHFVSIGYEGYFEDELLWMLWEHIRRYMEEGGPPIPHGEKLRPPTKGRPIEYPPEVIEAAGGPPLTESEIERLAEAAPVQ